MTIIVLILAEMLFVLIGRAMTERPDVSESQTTKGYNWDGMEEPRA